MCLSVCCAWASVVYCQCSVLVSVIFGECCVYVVLVSVVLGGLCVLICVD